MNLRLAILSVLQDADLRGASLPVMTPHVQSQAIGEAWTRTEIQHELVKLLEQGLVARQRDRLQDVDRYFITTQGRTLIAQ